MSHYERERKIVVTVRERSTIQLGISEVGTYRPSAA